MEKILHAFMVGVGISVVLSIVYYVPKWILIKLSERNIIGNCKHCGTTIKKKDEIFTCPVCSSIYHAECYRIHEGCANSCEESS